MAYRSDIDGLRAIAVLAVVLYHAGVPGISGGFVGVDVFFVISGFLITTLIVQQLDQGSFSLGQFYARRARRLFPALLAVLLVSIVLAWVLLMPAEFEDFGESLATAAAFSSNLLFWSEAGYFDGPSEFKPLLHTWSLAIEEQYYLIFPLLLLALQRWAPARPNRARRLLLGATFLLSFALAAYYVHNAPSAAFFLLPHRFWELLTGSGLAVFCLQQSEWISGMSGRLRIGLAWIGAGLLGVALFGFNSATTFPGPAAVLPCFGTAALILAGSGLPVTTAGQTSRSLITRALSLRAPVAIGLISYSLYLWHWPVLVFQKLWLIRPPTGSEIAFALVLSSVLAWLSWRYIERPFRQGFKAATQQQVLRFTGAISLALIAMGLVADQLDGIPARLPAEVVSIAQIADDKPAERKRCTGIDPALVTPASLCRIGSGTGKPDFLVWGDSHAMTLVPQLAKIADEQGRVGLNATRNGCAALLGMHRPDVDPTAQCEAFNSAVLKILQNDPNLRQVLLIGRWAIYAQGTRYKFESGNNLVAIDAQVKPGPTTLRQNPAVTARSLNRTIAAVQGLGREPVVLAGIPEVGWHTPTVLARAELLQRRLTIAPSRAEHDLRQANITPHLQALEARGIRVFWPGSVLCDNAESRCQIATRPEPGGSLPQPISAQPIYIDEDHLSSRGAALLRPLLSAMLAESKR